VKTRLVSLAATRTTSVERTTAQSNPVVMDVLPWPNGYGFTGHDTWWHHVLSQSERERLDNLIGLALLDTKVCERLVTQRDSSLFSTFDLSDRTQDWLKSIQATTLKELAQAIVGQTKAASAAALSEAA